MDDFNLEGNHMDEALARIAWINRLLGGNRITVDAVRKLARQMGGGILSVTDLGCGNGDMLRALDKMAQQEGVSLQLKGIDANPYTVALARRMSEQRISYQCSNILDKDFIPETTDITLLTLTLHHFSDDEIRQVLLKAARHTRVAIIVNDLQRSRLAYGLFAALSFVCRLGTMNDNDGKLSIRRGFRKNELEAIARRLQFKHYSIRWRWAFRYSWIITDL